MRLKLLHDRPTFFPLCSLLLAPHKGLILQWNLSVLVKTKKYIFHMN